MEKRLFIITNPTHYLNIQNYVQDNKEAENYIFLIIRAFKGDGELKEKIKNDRRFKILHIMQTAENSRLNNYINVFKNLLRLKLLAKRHPFFDKIFFTNYKSWNQHLVLNKFQTHKKILVSDGTGILLIAEDRRNSIEIPFKAVPFNGNRFFIKNVLSITPIEHLHFYSPIIFDVAERDSIEIFKYNPSGTPKVNKKKVFFIGSPFVENEYLSMNTNLKYLKYLKNYYKDCEIIYFAHRREKDKNLERYNFLGEIVKNSTPFEEMLQNEKELPGVIISYISSVLVNLYLIYPQINFKYIDLDLQEISGSSLEAERYSVMKVFFEKIHAPNFERFPVKNQ